MLYGKCWNDECLHFGMSQPVKGGCTICGAPLHAVALVPYPRPDRNEEFMYVVRVSGPKSLIIPIRRAENKDDASAKAIGELPGLGYNPDDFRVEAVVGPEDLPRFRDS